jgi:hypothetical protein
MNNLGQILPISFHFAMRTTDKVATAIREEEEVTVEGEII